MTTLIKVAIALALILLGLLLTPSVQSYEPVVVKPDIKTYASQRVINIFGENQWESFNKIISKESLNWSVTDAHYKTGYTSKGVKSSAYGLCGFLDSTWKTTVYMKTSDPYDQVDACIEYIQERYETPNKAWSFHTRQNWF